MATQYSIQNARLALPHLVECAQRGETITYGELGAKIGRQAGAAAKLLVYIRDEICAPRGLPLLPAIVVNEKSGLPGRGWLQEGAAWPPEDEHRRRFEKDRDAVFAFDGWDALLEELELAPVSGSDERLDGEGRSYARELEKTGGAGESLPHQVLKSYVARNPRLIKVSSSEEGEQEYLFVSGDRCDVVFDLGGLGYAVVEIKDGERAELVKGIYQTVKYRALMEAEKGHGQPVSVAAHLVALDEIPGDVRGLARKLDVGCHIVSRSDLGVG